MAKKFWLGAAPAIKQVQTITITAFDAATTYKVTIGGETVSVVGATDANATATSLKNALVASTHPYFTAAAWTVATNVVTGTAADAGEPFVATVSVTGGIGTISTAVTTASTGPNHLAEPKNWSGGTLPAAGDDIIVDRGASICWDLEHLHINNLDPASLTIMQSFTGTIGLDARVFATNAAATTTSATAIEYRPHYFKARCTKIDLGQPSGALTAAGSGRIKIDNTRVGASTTTVHGTAVSSTDAGLPAVRLLAANAGADIYVRDAPAGSGIAVDNPAETSTIGKLSISTSNAAARVLTGDGVTLSNYEQSGGNNVLRAAATISAVKAYGGTLTLEGDYTVTTLTVDGAVVFDNHIKTAGNAITSANLNAGTLDLRGSNVPRTIATLNPNAGTLKADKDIITIATLNQPAATYQIVVT